ncbi:hypothetical protein [Bacillus sp. V3-13]|uniref:hypothetical protein n=1 Tax=Bacillus sp. V3-13 TaxID=2053728 RepID=UPI0015E06502|nr:hypothetical protein [Bacillus sp. V3-13]
MYDSTIDFNKISKALAATIETIKQEHKPADSALMNLEAAREQLQQALSFSLSSTHK